MKTPSWFLQKSFIAYTLMPLSFVYYAVAKIVFWLRGHDVPQNKIPIVCVGGILAGGVGKTPIVRELAHAFNAPVVMRGYGRNDTHETKQVRKKDNVDNVGDEAKMLFDNGINVYVGARKKSIEQINADARIGPCPRAIILDDGFQNPTIRKNFSVLVFDEKIGFGNGFLLPAGPLREPVSTGIRRADAICVVQGTIQKTKNEKCDVFMSEIKKYGKPIFIVKTETVVPISNRANQISYVAFSGIGYPQKFFDSIREKINLVDEIPFPDHYNFTDLELRDLRARAKKLNAKLITTEKDFARLPTAMRRIVVVAPQVITLPQGLIDLIKRKA